MTEVFLALDFGGTKHAAAIAAVGEAQWRDYRRRLAPANSSSQTDLQVMRTLIQELLNGSQPVAIGVSFGGPVDFATGTVRLSHHVPGWENLPLQKLLESEFGVPVLEDNDANVAALGEQRFGAGQGCSDLLYITVSTGVGGGWILNGEPWRGFEGMAGEIGHIVVDPQGPICLCGKRGCVERLASGRYLAQDAREQLQDQANTPAPILRSLIANDLSGNLEALTAQHLSQAAAQGDQFSQAILRRGATALGIGIGNVANLINPQCFILGGGVTQAGEFFWQPLQQSARATALPEVHFEIMPTALQDQAPLWGAIALASAAKNQSRQN